MEYTAPNLIPVPFAANGEKNEIPQTVSDPSSNQASYSAGFPPITMVPRVSAGKPPQGKDMNGILYDITSNIMYTNAGGIARFNQDFCTAIGGYPKGAVLQDDLGEKLYVSLVDNNTVNFNTTSYEGYWEEHGAGGVKTINNMTPDANGNISVSFPVTSVNGKTGAVMVGTVRSINGLNPDATGNVTLSGVPTGALLPFSSNQAPDGYLLCNGATVSRTTYAALFAAIGTTYGAGDGSTTFNLPNYTDKFIQGSGTAGTVKAAGLPNIQATFNVNTQWNLMGSTGAVTGVDLGQRSGPSGSSSGTNGWSMYTFDASLSSSIYGASTTVQPPAVTARVYIKY